MCSTTQSCQALCDPRNCSPPGSSIQRILQARTLEWIAISFSRRSSQPRDRTHVSYIPCIGRQILYHWATEEVPIQEDHPAKTQDNFTCPSATEQNKIIDSCKCDFHGTLPAHTRCRVGWTWCADFMCYLLFLEKNIDYLILTRNYLNFDNCNHLRTDCNKATERRTDFLSLRTLLIGTLHQLLRMDCFPWAYSMLCTVTHRLSKTARGGALPDSYALQPT